MTAIALTSGLAVVVGSLASSLAIADPPSPSAATNLLKNAGFEAGNGDVPDGWVHNGGVAGVTYAWDKTVAHGGTASLELKKTAHWMSNS
jgi:hypothetical protein